MNFLYLFPLFLLSALSFWRELLFTFTKDDWGLFWSSLHTPKDLLGPYWLHPATPIEFLLLSHVFGYHPFLWMFLGLCIRVGISYNLYIFIQQLTKSKFAGMLAGLFFASTYAALESIGFISAHAGSISLFFILLSLYFFVRFTQEKKYSPRNFLIFYMVGFALDPGRTTPTIVLLPLLYVILKGKIPKNIFKYWKAYVSIGSVLCCILLVWFITHSEGSLFTIFFTRLSHDHMYGFKKLYLFGNYFAAIGNLLLGWVIPIAQDAQNTGVYNGIIGRIGLTVGLVTLMLWFFYIKSKNKTIGILAYFLLWMFLFYFPNWLFEPRAPMAGPHRYQVFPAVGFVSITAYCLAHIKTKWVAIVLAAFFICMNIATANRILAYQQTFRSKALVENLWTHINREVPKKNDRYLFIFTGSQPILSQSLEEGGIFFYAYKRRISSPKDIPMVTNSLPTIMQLLCAKENPIAIRNVFAWEINSQGRLRNYSDSERILLSSAMVECK